MRQEILQILIENLSVLVASGTTALIAFITRLVEKERLRKKGSLRDKIYFKSHTKL